MSGALTIFAAVAIAFAAETATTSPATAPAPVPAPSTASAPTPATSAAAVPALDQSSPKALLRSFYASGGEVDDATVRALLHASNDLEQKVLDAVVQVELANTRLRIAEREKFGRATTAPSVGGRLEPANLSELDSFTENVEVDRATVIAPTNPATAMQFVKVDDKWKIPIASLVGPIDPAVADTMGATTRAQIDVIEGVTAEVRAGTLTTEEQVRAELTKRLAAKLASTNPAGGAPAPPQITPAPATSAPATPVPAS